MKKRCGPGQYRTELLHEELLNANPDASFGVSGNLDRRAHPLGVHNTHVTVKFQDELEDVVDGVVGRHDATQPTKSDKDRMARRQALDSLRAKLLALGLTPDEIRLLANQ